jgi:hypothetical protein
MEYGDVVWRDVRAVQYRHALQPGALEREARAAGLNVSYHNPQAAAFVLTA